MEWEYTGFIWNANVTLVELSIHRDIGGFCLRCVQAMYDGESDLLFSELAPDLDTAKRRAAELYAELLRAELARVETPARTVPAEGVEMDRQTREAIEDACEAIYEAIACIKYSEDIPPDQKEAAFALYKAALESATSAARAVGVIYPPEE